MNGPQLQHSLSVCEVVATAVIMLTNMRTRYHGDSQKEPVNTRCRFGAWFLKSNMDIRSFFKQKEKPNENISEAASNTDRNPPTAAAASDGLAAAGRRYAGTCRERDAARPARALKGAGAGSLTCTDLGEKNNGLLSLRTRFFRWKLCEKVGSSYNRGLTVDTCW